MNKSELIDRISEEIGLTKTQVEGVLRAFEDVVTKVLSQGDEVSLTGFGTFMARHRAARMGVNPQKPSERISVPAVTVPKFKAGKSLKDALKHTGLAAESSDQ